MKISIRIQRSQQIGRNIDPPATAGFFMIQARMGIPAPDSSASIMGKGDLNANFRPRNRPVATDLTGGPNSAVLDFTALADVPRNLIFLQTFRFRSVTAENGDIPEKRRSLHSAAPFAHLLRRGMGAAGFEQIVCFGKSGWLKPMPRKTVVFRLGFHSAKNAYILQKVHGKFHKS